ncbi:MAG: Eco57I restriction-modification methylase domain-containing protein [Propionibacteriaceae bacterium]|nr:Eco57I restriction-modification methylase domain-containing protein [Propionibacteriaceae bacterium]
MLDLAGYTTDRDLVASRLLEPACGAGSFLMAAARRLLESWRRTGTADTVLDGAIRAVEVDASTLAHTRQALIALLTEEGLSELSAARIAKSWLIRGDFLSIDLDGPFDIVIGNPPYVRQELLPPHLLAQYRRDYSTMIGRADIYVAFFQKGLTALGQNGQLCFICADAWTRNDYGRHLRRLVTRHFALRAYVDMYGSDSFEDSVGAYPSITLIARGKPGVVRTGVASSTDETTLAHLRSVLSTDTSTASHRPSPPVGDGPWLLRGHSAHSAIRDLEDCCPTLEDEGCKVGIGVATGADKIFIAPLSDLPVEEDRKLPLAVNRDITQGCFEWHGLGVVNPWTAAGDLVDLGEYPLLAAYLEPHRTRLSRRHTARTNPEKRWHKTIDKISVDLTWTPKLFIPDIRPDGDSIAYDPGGAYPHHNLYHITSDSWDLRALQTLLRSGLARLFVEAYSVRIGGGYLRFQAQYLRRIRIPAWRSLSADQRTTLAEAGTAGAKVSPRMIEEMCNLSQGTLDIIKEWS